jgi:hypothetical protein
MQNRVLNLAFIAAVAIGWISSAPRAAGQAKGKQPAQKAGAIPRTADGKPDLSGVWEHGVTIFDMTKNSKDGMQIVDLGGGTDLPYTAWGLQKFKEYNGWVHDPGLYCEPVGPLRSSGGPLPTKIIQTPKEIIFLHEGRWVYHVVYMDRTEHEKGLDPTSWWYGDSIGRWDGDTLVVDTTNMNDKTLLDLTGHPHSDKLHLIERYTRTSVDRLTYEVTVDDPIAYTHPWKNTRIWINHPDWKIEEFACDNNKDVEHMPDAKPTIPAAGASSQAKP